MGCVETGKCRNRHIEFIQSIFMDISEEEESGKTEEHKTTLDELLAYLFDEGE